MSPSPPPCWQCTLILVNAAAKVVELLFILHYMIPLLTQLQRLLQE